jgi:uncharacterized protein (TIGR03086 family)
MSENLRAFTRAIYAFDAVVQRVPADRWDAQTPCDDWNAKQLVEHQCSVLNGVATIAETGQMAAPTPSPDSDDPTVTWSECRDRLLAALDVQGALAQEGPFWFRAATVDDLCAAVTWDPVTHAWDLATATGIDHGLADDLVEWTIATVEPRVEMLSESGRTGPPIEVDANAPTLDRYLALVGRTT